MIGLLALGSGVLPTAGVSSMAGLAFSTATSWVDEPNDPLFRKDPHAGVEEQWNLMSDGRGIAATEAWKLTHGEPAVVVADVDSGVNFRHEDLRNQFYLNAGELPLPRDNNGTPAGVYDLNADGIFNVLDYGRDGRVEDEGGDGVDVTDLLRAFSDGSDDDGNGYVDDISGWDFFNNDNDPSDAGDYGHGTQTSSVVAAETNNGVGMAGVAPRCRVMALRVGDAPHLSHSQILGEAVIYAADNGARVVSMSLGCMSNSPFLEAGFRYAAQKGTVSVAAMGNEYSFHHNYPATYEDVIGVGAIHPDTSGMPYPLFFPTSWVTRGNYSDYGGSIDLAAPSWVIAADYPDGYQQHSGGTSNAVPHVSAVAALIFSLAEAARLEPPLSAAEVRQILCRTAEDIIGTAYNCLPGFDQWTGYGRVRADRAVSAVEDGDIPPVACLQSPEWYATLDPKPLTSKPTAGCASLDHAEEHSGQSPLISVQGSASAGRSAGYSYDLSWAPGVEPLEGDFQLVCASALLTRAADGELCRWDIRQVWSGPSLPLVSPNDPAVTLRLRVTDSDGRQAEDRRTLFVHHDPSLHSGFPKHLGASLEGSVRLVDLDGDNRQEIVCVSSEGLVYAYRADGTLLSRVHGRTASWPAGLDPVEALASAGAGRHGRAPAFTSGAVRVPSSPVVATPAVADLDGDGILEIVVAATDGKVYVFEPDGTRRPGFPVSVDPDFAREDPWLESRIMSSPALADLDLDGEKEIVVGGLDQRVYVWRSDGSSLPGWPALARDPEANLADKIFSSVAVGDIDGRREPDGLRHPEVVVGTNELTGELPVMHGRVHAFGYDGRMKTGWPVQIFTPMGEMLPTVGKGVPMNPVLVDLNGDGGLEVIVSAVMGALTVILGNGKIRETLPLGPFGGQSNSLDPLLLDLPANAALGDLNRDGTPDLVVGGVGARLAIAKLFEGQKFPFDHLLGCWDLKNNRFLEAYPRVTDGFHFITQPVVADVTGEGVVEIVDGTSHYLLRAFSEQGQEPAGWPKFTGGWIVGCPAVGEVDGDGLLEVAVGTREGSLFLWDTLGSALQTPGWWTFHHDPCSTGNHHADLWPPASIEDLTVTADAQTGKNGVTLAWTAVGDNGRQGRAAAYEIRRSGVRIDLYNWPQATRIGTTLTPGEAGQREEVFLEGESNRIFFAVRAVDAAGNLSGLFPAETMTPQPVSQTPENGGCGCAMFPGPCSRSGWQPLVSALIYLLPLAFAGWLRRGCGQHAG